MNQLFDFTHDDLVRIAFRWLHKNGSCGVVFRELKSYTEEIPDVIGFGMGSHSVMIECKVSRSDFFQDAKKPFRVSGRGMGKYRFYCTPKGLIKPEELPEKWGLICVSQDGKAQAQVNSLKLSDYAHERNVSAERAVMYTALRRLYLRGHVESIYKMPESITETTLKSHD